MQYLQARLLIFAKAPITGTVKTRLIPALGAQRAADLQRRLTQRLLAALAEAKLCPLELWVAPDTEHPFFQNAASRYGVTIRQQVGRDLGQRMAGALADALCRAEAAIVIGTDCPLLSAELLAQALAALSHHDAVLGPVEDGGYALLGLKRHEASLFQDMPWSTDVVAELTRQRMRRLGWNWLELPRLWDVDCPRDLPKLYALLPEFKPLQ